MIEAAAVTLDHVGLVVSDLERSTTWYASTLGARPVGEVRGDDLTRSRRMEFANIALELTAWHINRGQPYDLGANDAGAFHLCPRVDDLAVEHDRLTGLGVMTTTPPTELVPGTGMRTVFLRDPDGVLVQLLEVPGSEPLGRGPREIHHVGVTVSGLERTAAWYEESLGLPVLSWHENGGQALSRMFEVPGTNERAALVGAGTTLLELMQWDSPPGRAFTATPDDIGVGHLCFARKSDGPASHVASHVLEDPDGIEVRVVAAEPADVA